MYKWAFIDDQPDPAAAFAHELSSRDDGLEVEVIRPDEARGRILSGAEKVNGILVDVDLSDVPGNHGSGPGISQDVRINQESGKLGPFPLVRFSSKAKVAANIGADYSSDDLFDLKIDKEFAAKNISVVQRELVGCSCVYECVAAQDAFDNLGLAHFLAVDADILPGWTHSEFTARARSARADKPHIAAALIMRLLSQSGPLITEDLLSVRLGVDAKSDGWPQLREALAAIKYSGKACDYFDRWWARGVEDWWLDTVGAESPLSSTTIEKRLETLASTFPNLTPITMPEESLGTRPYRLCTLSREQDPPVNIPVDPAYGVRMVRRSDAVWFDPTCAALGIALQHKSDARLDVSDLERHSAAWRS